MYTDSTCILPCLVWFRVYIHSITALLYGNIAHLVVLPVTNQMVIGSNPAMGMCGSWKGDVPEVNMYSELVIQETSGLGPLVTLKYHIHHSNNKIPSRNKNKNLPPSNPTGQKGVFYFFLQPRQAYGLRQLYEIRQVYEKYFFQLFFQLFFKIGFSGWGQKCDLQKKYFFSIF